MIRGVAPPTSSHREFETKIESVWWSKKEKEKERGKQWRRKARHK